MKFLRFVALSAFTTAAFGAQARSAHVWTRLELVENTAEGPAYNRCQLEATLEKGQKARWRLYYGEARADSSAGWLAIRSSSGCVPVGADHAAAPWTLRGSPYFLVDVAVGQAGISGREILIEAALSIQTLTGFAQGGAPTYETRTEKRTVRVPEGSSAAFPILIASEKESAEFRVRELVLKFRASVSGLRPPVEYGELTVAADVPRAEIFLDGGLVGRTSSDGPVVLHAVRAGEREVVVLDASGREARAVARVEKGHRTSVSLALMKGSPASASGMRPLGRNPQGAEEFWREKDGAIVVRIPGGEFQMGNPEAEGRSSERPRHGVRVRGFLMDKTEVTWGQYKRFLAASSQPPAKIPVWGTPEAFPASNITWDEARAFCAWAGGRLPTEAEWERAAQGDESRRYPWGNDFEPWRCNTRDGGPHGPTPAAAYPDCVSPYGVRDLPGSVSEWCSDWYDEKYYAESPVQNPPGPESGKMRVSRGGSWYSLSGWVRVDSRLGIDPELPDPKQGFRCAQEEMGLAPQDTIVPAQSPDASSVSNRIELRIETLANRDDGPAEPCAVTQAKSANASLSFVSWSTLGEATQVRCGIGASPSISPAPSGATPAPFLINDVSVVVGWDAAAHDPGPGEAVAISLTLTTRQLTGLSEEGKPVYSVPVRDHRSTRLELGEEYFLPVLVDPRGSETLGVHEVLLRIRAGTASREGGTEYGALAFVGAVPGSKIVVDGGDAGRAGADGSLLLTNVPEGQRDVRIQNTSGSLVSRNITVVRRRTIRVSPGEADSGSPIPSSLTPTDKNQQGFQEYRRARDGATMVQIPEGEFLMGNLEAEGAPLPHTVYVSSFLMDKVPLTVGRFKRFASATGLPLPPDPYWGVHDEFPVAFVRWEDARAYCEWAGGRLPTEAEREKATRGTDGRMFPWGSELPSPDRAVFSRKWGEEGNDAVGSRQAGASPYGLLDTEGNMWESCEDWWQPDYYNSSPQKDPAGPKTGRARVYRGGSWDSRWVALSASKRNFAAIGFREGDFGFRCASDPPR